MRLGSALFLGLAILTANAFPAAAQGSYTVFSGTADFTGGYLKVECLMGDVDNELRATITIRDGGSASLSDRETFAVTAGRTASVFTAQRFSTDILQFRTMVRERDFATFEEIGKSLALLESPRPFKVELRIPSIHAQRTFTKSSAVSEAIAMCKPSTAAAYREARRMRNARAIITLADYYDSKCRGGAGDDQRTQEACDARTGYMERLNELGYCYGRESEFGYQYQWHVCGWDSFRSPFSRRG